MYWRFEAQVSRWLSLQENTFCIRREVNDKELHEAVDRAARSVNLRSKDRIIAL